MAVDCPYPGCTFATQPDTAPIVTAAILNGHMLIHSQAARPKPTPVRRPEIAAGGTTEGWQYFLTRWRAYSQAVRLAGTDVTIQLLECLDTKLRRDVTRNIVGTVPIENFSEEDLLTAIKALAVREENPKVARVALSRMVQDRGEPIRAFAARLRGQAEVCRFVQKCSGCDVVNNQGEQRVADQLCIGLADADIQEDLLKDINQQMTVEETIRFVEVRAAGKRSAATITTPTSTSSLDEGADSEGAIVSGYRRQQRQPNPPVKATPFKPNHPPTNPTRTPTRNQPTQNRGQPTRPTINPKAICCFCGRQGHGERERTAIRRTQCPAFGTQCSSCNRPNHYANMCWLKLAEQESAITEHTDTMAEGSLPHQSWDSTTSQWIQRRSPPQPNLEVHVSSHKEDYRAHGHTLREERHNLATTALADTGCQSCLAGPLLQRGLGLSNQDLIPATLHMNSASGNALPILGAALLRIRSSHSKRETRQMVYFSPLATKLYLSLATCADLGLIATGFPLCAPMPLPLPQDQLTRTRDPDQPPSLVQDLQTRPRGAVTRPSPAATPADLQTRPREHPVTPLVSRPIPTTPRPCSCPTRAPPPPRPTSLPFPGTEANRHRLERHLLELYSASAFNVCEHQPLPMMSGPPLSLNIDPNATPKPCHNPIDIPIHWQDEVKAGLDRDVRLGVLEKVPLGTPVTWCHRMVICTKKDGSLRRTINLQPLNQHATRETHHCPSPFHQARAVPGNTKKTIFDAWNGYHSVALNKDDRHYTTFITPWGRYRYCTAPQGYTASGDAYTARYDALVAHVTSKTKCIDDALLWSDDITGAYHQATEWLNICAVNGITLNPRKFRFAQDRVEFAGFDITPTEVRPSPKFLESITDFPTPTGITDIRAWFGLVNQVAYAFSLTAAMLPFRALLKPTTPFHWTTELDDAFTASKLEIVDRIKEGVAIFDKGRPTCLATDWSKDGIGYWLFQKHCQCPSREIFCCQEGWRVTLVGSRFTHSAESRYAPVEGEALAVADALDKARHFVLGCSDLVVAVDHKPLLKLFGDRCLEDIPNPRLRNIKERTLRYRFRMVYIPGVRNLTSDALSRHPAGTRAPPRLYLPDDIDNPNPACPGSPDSPIAAITEEDTPQDEHGLATALCMAVSTIPINWEQLQVATANDPPLQELSFYIENGPPDTRHMLPPTIRDYFAILPNLSIVDGVVCHGDRLVVPTTLRPTCLAALHAAHQGISGMTARATSSIYWPGMTADIASTRNSCSTCNGNAPSQPAMPSTTPEEPEYPFQHICADYFHHEGSAYLVLVDRYSGWPITQPATNGASGLATILRDTFATYGIPDTLTSDGGPEFASHSTRELLTAWGVRHRISAAYHPHSNNRAETAVKTMKRLIAGNTDPGGVLGTKFFKAILIYRNSPSPDTRMSPAECLFGRPIRDIIPGLPTRLTQAHASGNQLQHRQQALSRRQTLGRARWDEHSRGLSPLRCGDKVTVQNQTGRHPTKWDKSGVVVEVLQYHQYIVRMDGSGRLTTRNRQFLRRQAFPTTEDTNPLLRQLPPTPPTPPPPTPTPATPPPTHPSPQTPPTSTNPSIPSQTIPPLPSPLPPSRTTITPTTDPQVPTPSPHRPTVPTTPTTRQSYAAVAGTPTPPRRPTQITPTNPALRLTLNLPKTPAPEPRRSNRGPKPIDRYGH